jgi:hypothetical protein
MGLYLLLSLEWMIEISISMAMDSTGRWLSALRVLLEGTSSMNLLREQWST